MPNLTSFNKLIYSFLLYFYIKVHGLVAAHKKNIYEGTDFIQQAPQGATYTFDIQCLMIFNLTAMRTCGICQPPPANKKHQPSLRQAITAIPAAVVPGRNRFLGISLVLLFLRI